MVIHEIDCFFCFFYILLFYFFQGVTFINELETPVLFEVNLTCWFKIQIHEDVLKIIMNWSI